jgi:hypothetical protein
MQEENQRLA